ncbi:2-polyprenyl-6-methoxyphenol hydroxylase [Chryseobacterium culicis]|uniref:2-polyprenyl-6-methoxyphenol hydroxylase n=2 Tax=Chryseobacterium culicis TaxID=680127 RepID=A0A1H6H2L4_CHRCI|nr:2-polyprenyl-6-methoxyphenol hydroxylase [Chryseobacterium culicis]
MINTMKAGYDVIVVGAGPTGLMLASELKLQGASVAVIERRAHGTSSESRAPGINARTMEILGMRGLAEDFKALGKPLEAVLFSGLMMMPKKWDDLWPDALILPQHQTEKLLREYAEKLGVIFHWSTELIDFYQDENEVKVHVKKDNEVQQLNALYLAGCDGGRSKVREICGASFTGEDPQSHWIVADVELKNPPAENQRFGRNSRIGTYQVSSVEEGWFRVSLMKIQPPLDQRAKVTLEELRQAMLEGIGTDFGLVSARWMSRFTDSFRQVSQYRFQRILLLGDAAHTHSPIGGQGLNLGIQDAVNLGWKLAWSAKGLADEKLLDTFNEERHPVGALVLKMAKAQTALIKPNPQIEALRSVVGDLLISPESTLKISRILSGLGIQYSFGAGLHPLVGQRMPDVELVVNGIPTSLYALMHSGKGIVLNLNDDISFSVPEIYKKQVETIRAVSHISTINNQWKLSAVGEVPVVSQLLIRPDGFVAWTNADETTGPENILESWLSNIK